MVFRNENIIICNTLIEKPQQKNKKNVLKPIKNRKYVNKVTKHTNKHLYLLDIFTSNYFHRISIHTLSRRKYCVEHIYIDCVMCSIDYLNYEIQSNFESAHF